LRRLGVHPLPLNESVSAATDKQILRDRQIGAKRYFLIDRADSDVLRLQWKPKVDSPSLYGNPTGVLFVNAGYDLYQCGLARSVFAHEGMDLTLSEREVHVMQSPDPWKGFADTLHFEHLLRPHPGASFGYHINQSRCGVPDWIRTPHRAHNLAIVQSSQETATLSPHPCQDRH
jgi:hypothetical protein